jgi:hypothetical protein
MRRYRKGAANLATRKEMARIRRRMRILWRRGHVRGEFERLRERLRECRIRLVTL